MNDGMYGISQMMGGFAGGLTQVWLNVAFVVCAFTALIVRPARISNGRRFRTACFLFCLSLILPSFSLALSFYFHSTNNEFGVIAIQYSSILTALLYSMAFYIAVTSMIPSTPNTPLEDNPSN